MSHQATRVVGVQLAIANYNALVNHFMPIIYIENGLMPEYR